MKIFAPCIENLRQYMSDPKTSGPIRQMHHNQRVSWPAGNGRNVVLISDMAIEVGGPKVESFAFTLCVNDEVTVRDGMITLIGPEIVRQSPQVLPFGKLVIAKIRGLSETNYAEFSRDLDAIRFMVDLKGYMIRAELQYLKEWSRISKEALRNGFSLETLAGALIDEYKTVADVEAVEVILVTSTNDDVKNLRAIMDEATRFVAAIKKRAEEPLMECDDCEFQVACTTVKEMEESRHVDREIGRKNG